MTNLGLHESKIEARPFVLAELNYLAPVQGYLEPMLDEALLLKCYDG
jgi:hypothetical protein